MTLHSDFVISVTASCSDLGSCIVGIRQSSRLWSSACRVRVPCETSYCMAVEANLRFPHNGAALPREIISMHYVIVCVRFDDCFPSGALVIGSIAHGSTVDVCCICT